MVDFQNDSIILEMNRTYYKGLLRKNYDYIFKGYNLLYHRGETYQIKKRMIQINFDLKPFSCFPKGYEEKVIRDATILDRKDGFSHQDIIMIYHISRFKIKEKYYNGIEMSRVEKLLLLLVLDNLEELKKIAKGDEVMEEAVEKIQGLSQLDDLYTEKEREEVERRAIYEQNMYHEEIGHASGLKEGRREGRKEGVLNTAKKLLYEGIDPMIIMRATGLNKKQLESLR